MSSSSQLRVTADDRGPLLALASWLTLAFMCMATFTKVGTKLARIGNIQMDDIYMLIAMLTAIGHAVAIFEQVSDGLGQHVTSLTLPQFDDVQQAVYASQILYILSLCFAKLALLQIYTTFVRNHFRTMVVRGAMTLVVVWATTAVFATAFQCHLPQSWAVYRSDQCFNQPAFWDAIGAVDILTDLCIAILPVWLLHDLQVSTTKKVLIMIAFAERILVAPLTILRLVYISAAAQSADSTFTAFNTTLTTVINTNLSIILACVPFLKPFVDSLQIGLFNSDPRFLVPRNGRPNAESGYYSSRWSEPGKSKASNRFQLGSWSKRKNNNINLSSGELEGSRSS